MPSNPYQAQVKNMKLVIQQVVKDNSALVLFKVRLKTLARKLGFDSVRMENMQIVASEMLSNQIKYSGKTGMVQLWCNAPAGDTRNKNAPPVTLDIFAMDYGPGIADIEQALQDGYTTSRTMGKGLGSIKRLADEYDVYSRTLEKEKSSKSWHGVAIWARFYLHPEERPTHYQLGTFERAWHDNVVNGDDIQLQTGKNQLACLHLDATGHGQAARDIIARVQPVRSDVFKLSACKMLDWVAKSLTGTKGAAGVALKYNVNSGRCEYSAVGDMRLCYLDYQEMTLPEVASGILGNVSRNHDSQYIHLANNSILISASDGIRRNWTMETFQGLWVRHAQIIAFVLGNRKGRSSDDQFLLVIKKI